MKILEVALLFDFRLLTAQVTQVVQLGTTYVTARYDLDVVNNWGVHGELTLHTNLERNLTNGESFANALTGTTDNNTLEYLDTRAVTFDDVYVNLYGVTGAELWNVATQRWCVYSVKNVHDVSQSVQATGLIRE